MRLSTSRMVERLWILDRDVGMCRPLRANWTWHFRSKPERVGGVDNLVKNRQAAGRRGLTAGRNAATSNARTTSSGEVQYLDSFQTPDRRVSGAV
mmetsp:Transcript_48403/g.90696  ORF Transcript_48403/g.90696 Transcript_48403/m.90696 type:complete len:95 (+) Transcript_48403:295-579(+)